MKPYSFNIIINPLTHTVAIAPVSKQRLFIPDLLFIDHFTVSGDERRWPVARFLRELLAKIGQYA